MSEIQIDKKIVLNNAQGENLEPYITTDSTLSTESDNPIQNSAVTTELNSCLRYDVQGTSQGSSVIVTAHSGLTNLDFASSGHTGFLNNDASNLSSAGQKVFDGQWVAHYARLISSYIAYPQTEVYTINLTNELPQDNYTYEVMLSVVTRSGLQIGQWVRVELQSDAFLSSILSADAKCVVKDQYTESSSQVIIPVGAQRLLYVMPESTLNGTFSMWISGYRRIGTNS